ncbi:hypothetical protein MMC13_003174 [Lambiella insularis]|nr:hypothetical protein [Lambiella insularis]
MVPFSSASSFRPSFVFRRLSLRNTFLTLGAFATWVPMIVFFKDNVAQPMWVTGPSMYPFLNTDYNSTTRKDVVFVNMWAPYKGLQRGMIVAMWSPYHPENMIVKRIIALEGDEVVTRKPYPGGETALVPLGHVWVEGENPEDNKTLDSNTYGPVAKSLIVGQVKAVVWPWRKAGLIRWEDYRVSPRVLQGRHTFADQQLHVS